MKITNPKNIYIMYRDFYQPSTKIGITHPHTLEIGERVLTLKSKEYGSSEDLQG